MLFAYLLLLGAAKKKKTEEQRPAITIYNPYTTSVSKGKKTYKSADDPALKSYLTPIVGAQSAASLCKKIKFAKSTGTNAAKLIAGDGYTTTRRFQRKYTLINLKRESDNKITVNSYEVTTTCSVLSQIIRIYKEKRFLGKWKEKRREYVWRALTQSELNNIYAKIDAQGKSYVNTAIQKVKI